MADRNASRRLARILSDETYGPKLARLSKADSDRVLARIDAGDSRGARDLINTLDNDRRVTMRARHTARQAETSQTPLSRRTIEAYEIVAHGDDVLRRGAEVPYNAITVLKNAESASQSELRDWLKMTAAEWRALAARQTAPGDPKNKYWYH